MAQTAAAAAPTAAPATTDSAATTVPAAPTTADPRPPPGLHRADGHLPQMHGVTGKECVKPYADTS